MVRPVINSEKHIVQFPVTQVIAGAIGGQTIVQGTDDINPVVASDVAVGTVVKAVYLELWIMGGGAQPGSMNVIVEKRPSSSPIPTVADMNALNTYDNKKNIFEQHQGLVGDSNTNPTPFYRGWIAIPKGKQRIGRGDLIGFILNFQVETTEFCGIAIFKAYN